ncbi:MAG: hypothetical protein P1U36_07400 [Legionellaceae bacterium]|nr:hypothetical protein [Legionellaceae bacterium]
MKKPFISAFEAKFQAAALQHLMLSRIEKLQTIQRQQKKEGVASGERPVITLKPLSREMSVQTQTDIEFSNFNEQAYQVLPESIKEKLFLIETNLADAKISNQAIFDDIHNVFIFLRNESKFYTNQAYIQQCLKLAVECVKSLFERKTVSSDAKKYFQMTQSMFQYYFSHANDNRKMLALHLQFRDLIKSDDALIYLIQDEIDGVLLDIEEATYKTTQTRLSQAPDTLEEQPLPNPENPLGHKFSERWAKLQSASMKPKAFQAKLSNLSHEISQHTYAHKRSTNPTDWKTFLSLALAVEARLIEHMQTSRSPNTIRPLSKAMQRSAHYFRLLHIHYQHVGASKTLKAELKQSYELMETRSTNYEQMLACYYVETSEKTSPKEKENARQVRASYQTEMRDDTTALCAQYRELSQPLGAAVAPKKKSKPAKEISIENRRTLLETNLLAHSKSPYDLYQDARKYLNAVLNQASPKSDYDVTYLHQLDNHYDASVNGIFDPLESKQLLALALGDNRSLVKRAIELYYEAKCRHADELYKMHPSDNFITTERFCTHFRREAYAFLLQSCESGYAIQNLVLLKQNCLDIIHAENYRAPLLEALARHQLDAIAPRLAAKAASEVHAEKNNDTHIETSTPKIKILLHKAPKIAPATKALDEETIWKRLCAEYAVKSVNFNNYLNRIKHEGLTDETADFLYDAITNSDRRLLLDEDNEAAFFELYDMLLTQHYKPQEYEALEDAKADNILNAKKDAEVPADKRMPKSIKLGEALLQYSRVYSAKRQLDCLFSLGDSYLSLLKIAPTRAYKKRAEEVYREAPSHAKKMGKAADVMRKIMDAMRLIKAVGFEREQANIDALENSTLRKDKATRLINYGLFQSIENTPLDLEYRAQVIHQLGDNLILRSQINNLAFPITNAREYSVKTALFLQNLYQEQKSILSVLSGHISAMWQWYTGLPADVGEHYLHPLKKHHALLLDYCATMENLRDDQLLSLPEAIIRPFKAILPELEDKIQRVSTIEETLPTLNNMRKQKTREFSLIIPNDFRELSNLPEEVKLAMKLMDDKKYWQALELMASFQSQGFTSKKEVQPILFLNACILKWLVTIISSPHFKTSLGENNALITSYDHTVQAILDMQHKCLNKAKKNNKPLSKMCDALLKNTLSVLDGEAYLQACRLFNRTDETASGCRAAALQSLDPNKSSSFQIT